MKHFGTCALFLLLVLLIGDALAAPKLLHKYAKDMLMFPSTYEVNLFFMDAMSRRLYCSAVKATFLWLS